MNEAEREELIQKVAVWKLNRAFAEIVGDLGARTMKDLTTDPVLVIDLAAALNALLRYDEGLRILLDGRDAIESSGDQKLWRRYLYILSTQLRYRGRISLAKRLTDELLAAAVDKKDERLLANLYNGLGINSAMIGDVDQSMNWFARAIAVWQRLGDMRHLGLGHYNRGLVANLWQRTTAATHSFGLAQEYYERDGTLEEMICVRSSRALVEMVQGDHSLATELVEWSLKGVARVQSISLKASVLSTKGKLCVLSGDFDTAVGFFEKALSYADGTGDAFDRAEIAGELAIALRHAGHSERGAYYLQVARDRYERFGGHAYARRVCDRYMSFN